MNETSFSIIVPVYNTEEKFLKECIDSLNNLKYDNYEVIFVDDASDDDTKQILNKLIFKDNQKLFTHKKNKGLAEARKTGITKATGDYSLFLDSDDVFGENALNYLNDVVIKNHPDVIIHTLPRFSKSSNELEIDQPFFKSGNVDKTEAMTQLLSLHTNSICEKCAKTKLMKKVYDDIDSSIIMGEDLQQSTNLFLLANTFYYLDKRFYYYRINGNKSYYDFTNLNDMNFTLPTYRKVFVEHNEYNNLLDVYKLASTNAIIYRAFKLCKFKNKKELLNKLNETDIVKTTKSINKKIPLFQEMVFGLLIHKNYFLLNILAFVYNKTNPEF